MTKDVSSCRFEEQCVLLQGHLWLLAQKHQMQSGPQLRALKVSLQAEHCCHMQVTKARREIMITADDTQVICTCTHQALERVESFKYLGLPFQQSGHIAHLVTPQLISSGVEMVVEFEQTVCN